MWRLRGQFNRPNKEYASDKLEWSELSVETQAEAEAWWQCRTAHMQRGAVSTMFNPQGDVVRVCFG